MQINICTKNLIFFFILYELKGEGGLNLMLNDRFFLFLFPIGQHQSLFFKSILYKLKYYKYL
jgi:hypothetical protein